MRQLPERPKEPVITKPFVLYLDGKFNPVPKADAVMARITYPNGKTVMAIIKKAGASPKTAT